MTKMKTVGMKTETVDKLSDAISEFIHSVDDGKNLEGAYVVPCASLGGVRAMLLELVCGNNSMAEKIFRADQGCLSTASMFTGVEIKVETIPYRHYAKVDGFDRGDYPIRGMLKSGHIIYDPNGNLATLQEKYKNDEMLEDLSGRGAVNTKPPVQYKKVKSEN